MTPRGDATRAKLIDATQRVVREHGYASATTKAIAEAAGVSEGTIYRHFPDKIALFFEAALARDRSVLAELESLPSRAGTGTVVDNLARALGRLASLREDIIPLELAIQTDPVLAERRRQLPPPRPDGVDPPMLIGRYLASEQALGRVRADADVFTTAIVLLAMLLGLALLPGPRDDQFDELAIANAVAVVVNGIAPGTA